MKPNYQQPHNIKAPEWMNEAQGEHYRTKEHGRQKTEQLRWYKDKIYESEEDKK